MRQDSLRRATATQLRSRSAAGTLLDRTEVMEKRAPGGYFLPELWHHQRAGNRLHSTGQDAPTRDGVAADQRNDVSVEEKGLVLQLQHHNRALPT